MRQHAKVPNKDEAELPRPSSLPPPDEPTPPSSPPSSPPADGVLIEMPQPISIFCDGPYAEITLYF